MEIVTSEPAPLHSQARPESVSIRSADAVALASLTLLWVIPLAFIGISGNFPLNDDWAYARAAQSLLETGLIERTSWTWVPLISHSYFGAAVSLLASPPLEPVEVFRCVGLGMGWLGVLGTYALCRQVGGRPLISAIAAATVGLNPVYLNLSYTYMTDVPVAAMCAWSLFFLARALRTESWGFALAGAIVALLAALTRQTGMALPLAFAAAVFVASPIPNRAWVKALVGGAIVGFGYLTALEFAYGPEDPSTLFRVADMGLEQFPLFHLFKNSLVSLTYTGCFLGAVIVLPGVRDLLRPRLVALLAAGFTVAGLALVVRLHLEMPPGLNVIYNLGLGPHWLHGHAAVPTGGTGVWWILTALGFAAAAVAGVRLVLGVGLQLREVWRRPDWLLLLVFPAIFVFPHLFRSPFFDRYLLPTLAPFAAMLLVLPRWSGRPGRGPVIAAAAVLAVFLAYGTIGTRDYVERQRTGWAMLDELTRSGVDPHRIDGGFEFNGLFSFERTVLPDDIIWTYVYDAEYKLSHFEQLDGYELVASKSFWRVMPPGTETLRLFHRADDGD